MNQIVTSGIVLRRTDFGEADRIVVLLTPDHGKVSVVAKGVRRLKSKLAGGIELFSVSSITYLPGRSDLGTLISCRLDTHYGEITKDIERVQLGYELIKRLNHVTEDEVEPEYFDLLVTTFQALDKNDISARLIQTWFAARMLTIGGHAPNLHTDTEGQKLDADSEYAFDFDAMTFTEREGGDYAADQIKFLRLLFSGSSPEVLSKVTGGPKILDLVAPIIEAMQLTHLRA